MTALLDAKQAALRLGVSENWVRLHSKSDLPHVRLGRYLRFRPDDLDAYVAGRVRAQEPAAPAPEPERAAPALVMGADGMWKLDRARNPEPTQTPRETLRPTRRSS